MPKKDPKSLDSTKKISYKSDQPLSMDGARSLHPPFYHAKQAYLKSQAGKSKGSEPTTSEDPE